MAKKDDIPGWVSEEIQNAKFGESEEQKRTGYVLETYEQDGKVDAQLYEPIEDGRHIVTLDLPRDMRISDIEKGVVYEFTFDQYKAPLSREVYEYLKREKEIEMAAIYQFELRGLELLDVESVDSGGNAEE